MVELFIFLQGDGVLNLDGRNYTISEGSVATVYPPTKHTIYNPPHSTSPIQLLSVAAVP